MTTTIEDIRYWIQQGQEEGATDMIVVCDTFDHSDYPVFCKTPTEAREKVGNPSSMQKVMEYYNLTGDIEDQLSRRRCHEYSDD